MEIVIRAERLSKTFRVGFWGRRVRAVEDLSLEVTRGQIFGLLGPNGAGKTTTLKMLLGFVRPTRGQATIAGHRAGSLAARKAIGYLPENPALYEFLTGEEYLRFAGQLTDCGTLSSLLSPGVRAVEIVARDVPEPLSQRLLSNGAQGMRRDGALVLTFTSEAPAHEAMRAIVGAGGVLVSVSPHRETLESLFVQRARGTTAPSA